MEEQQRRRLQASAPALLVFLGGGGGGRGAGAGSGAGGREDRTDDAARGSGSCNLCGDVGFREALLPCGARGCSRLQHTYCGSRYCPDVVSDVNRWRCEWCAREDSNRRLREEGGEEGGEEEEREDSSSKRSRRAPPSRSLSPPEIKQQRASSSPERSADRQGRTACHREDRRGSTSPGARPHAPTAASPAGTDVPAAAHNMMITTHRDKQSINTRSSGGGGGSGGGSRALDRWKNLAKRTRLGGKKYKLLADVLC